MGPPTQPGGNWSVGCDGICILLPAKIDKCGVCGGTGAASTVRCARGAKAHARA